MKLVIEETRIEGTTKFELAAFNEQGKSFTFLTPTEFYSSDIIGTEIQIRQLMKDFRNLQG